MQQPLRVSLILLGTLALVFLAFPDAESPANDASAQSISQPAAKEETLAVEKDPEVRVAVAGPIYVKVVASDTLDPIPNAELWAEAKSFNRLIKTPSRQSVLATSDPGGLILVESSILTAGSTYLIRAASFTAKLLQISGSNQTISLDRAIPVEVVCESGTGKPLSGCRVVVASHQLGYPDAYRASGIGNPYSPRPLWVAISDSEGRAVLRGIPSGTYRVHVTHETHAPFERHVVGSVPVQLPCSPIRAVLREFFAVVVKPQNDEKIIWHNWKVDRSRFIRNSCVNRARRTLRRQLVKRYPGSIVFTALPFVTSELAIHVDAILEDGQECELDWALVPISHLTHPAYLEVIKKLPMTKVRIDLVHGSNNKIEGYPFELSRKGKPIYFGLESGVPSSIPAGTYEFSMTYAMQDLAIWAAKQRVELKPGDDRVVVLKIPFRPQQIRIKPRLPHPMFDTSLCVTVLQGGGSMAVMSWTPDDGPIDIIIPAGPLTLKVSGLGLEPRKVEMMIRPTKNMAPTVVELPASYSRQ